MNFLAPWLLPVAVLATVPPLLLLYFLKLKRRELPIASTLLWRRAVEDLQVNSPFQRLRNSLLLILQILALLLAALAISEPMLTGQRGVDKAIVIMIDRSGSMAAVEGDKTRLEIAKQEATRVVDDMTAAQRAMVITFADRSEVLAPFTDDKATLRRAIDGITQTEEPGRLTEAMALAEAHSTPVGEVGAPGGVEVAESQYMLFTDGRLADATNTVVQRGTLEIVRIGTSTENVGIVNLDVRRHYETPEQVSILARVRNFGTQPAARDVRLLVDGDLKAVQSVNLAPLGDAKTVGKQTLGGPSPDGVESNVAFELTLDAAARIEVDLYRKEGSDAFAGDDRAFALATAPRAVNVLLVTPGNRYLQRALEALRFGGLEVWSPQEYESKPQADLEKDGRCKYDVVVIDGHSTQRLPAGNYLFFGGIPIIDGVETKGTVSGEAFLDWDDTHPILRHVAIQAMVVFSWPQLVVPAQASTLIHGVSGPVMSLLARDRRQYLLCAFGIFDENRQHLNTTWVFQESLIVFLQNAVRYLAGASTTGQVPSVSPGAAFEVAVRPGLKKANVVRPDGSKDEVAVQPNNMIAYGRTDRIGIYTITPGLPGDDARAVNLLNETESWIAPNEQFEIAAGKVEQRTGKDLIKRAMWPYALVALAVILAVEWFIYNKRMYV